jgi:hypothetical protein
MQKYLEKLKTDAAIGIVKEEQFNNINNNINNININSNTLRRME